MALVTQVFLVRMIWTAVYGARPAAAGLTLDALLACLTLANLQGFATHTLVTRTVQHRVRTGTVFFDLARPVGYLRQMAAFQAGNTLGGLLLLAPVVPVVLLAGSITAPADAAGYVLTLLLGYVIAVQLALLISLIAFWTMEIAAVSLLYRLVQVRLVPDADLRGRRGVAADVRAAGRLRGVRARERRPGQARQPVGAGRPAGGGAADRAGVPGVAAAARPLPERRSLTAREPGRHGLVCSAYLRAGWEGDGAAEHGGSAGPGQ
uniref:Daunorubicin resistance transmembrane protein n=1 Tax=Nonomuraea gerenzanensis TaxID=93944 RepID=A0A1M4EBI8_9ACTN|nr:Daunorubicin resistance transmembrane protein [Nonomuraea gerenzanensis]